MSYSVQHLIASLIARFWELDIDSKRARGSSSSLANCLFPSSPSLSPSLIAWLGIFPSPFMYHCKDIMSHSFSYFKAVVKCTKFGELKTWFVSLNSSILSFRYLEYLKDRREICDCDELLTTALCRHPRLWERFIKLKKQCRDLKEVMFRYPIPIWRRAEIESLKDYCFYFRWIRFSSQTEALKMSSKTAFRQAYFENKGIYKFYKAIPTVHKMLEKYIRTRDARLVPDYKISSRPYTIVCYLIHMIIPTSQQRVRSIASSEQPRATN